MIKGSLDHNAVYSGDEVTGATVAICHSFRTPCKNNTYLKIDVVYSVNTQEKG